MPNIVPEVRLTTGPRLAKITRVQKLGLNSTHPQAVGRVAAPLKVLARSKDGVVESMQLKPNLVGRLPFRWSVRLRPARLTNRDPEPQAMLIAFTPACVLPRERKL